MSVTASFAELLRTEVSVADLDVLPGVAAAPEAVVHPESTEEVAATMRLASAHRVGVLVMASGARLHAPHAIERPYLVLRTDRLSGIEIYEPADLTLTLLARLGLGGRAGTVVSGDTLPQRKPHPAPLLHAARELGVEPRDCIYLGDAERDIEAGRAAGMRTVATSYGYIRPGEDFRRWKADADVDHPRKVGILLQSMTGSN